MKGARWQIVAGACACAAASAYAFAVDPAGGGYPRCLLYEATGLYCAGCGATRAFHALLHGRVLEAIHDNALFVALLPVMAAVVLPKIVKAWRDDRWPGIQAGQRTIALRAVAFVVVGLLFAIARNVPGTPFDWLRPLA